MASTFTDNLSLEKQAAGDNAGTWGDPILNTNVIQRVDDASGKTTTIALSSSNVTLTQTQWRSKAFLLTGTLTTNVNLILPLSVNDTLGTLAVGGDFVVNNQTTGAFNVTVLTAATASTGVTVPQGFRTVCYSNTTNVVAADDQAQSTILTNAGDPNGSITGVAGSVNSPASFRFDRTNGIIYACTTSGTVWSGIAAAAIMPQGYLTPNSSANNVILTADSLGAGTLFYTPYVGAFVPISNGSYFTVVPFSQLTLTLSASQASNGIYDVYVFIDSGVLRIGFGPSWSAGSGGSVTAGSCARGTGAGGAAIQRFNGLWVNTAAMTMSNGASTFSVSALRGTCVGTVAIDSTQGQVTCHRSWGQSRKFGVWNFYNRVQIGLNGGDGTASWAYTSNTIRASNNAAANSLTLFQGLQEEFSSLQFVQMIDAATNTTAGGVFPRIGVGLNSTSAFTGTTGRVGASSNSGSISSTNMNTVSLNNYMPPLGISTITSLEAGNGSCTFFGTQDRMNLSANWRG